MSSPLLPKLEEAYMQQQRPIAAENKDLLKTEILLKVLLWIYLHTYMYTKLQGKTYFWVD